MSGAVYDAEVQFHNCTLYLINGKQNLGEVRSGVASTKTGIKDGFDEEEHAFRSGTFFSGDPVFQDWKVSAKL